MSINELILAIAAAIMLGAAIYNGHQALVLRGINKRLRAIVDSLEKNVAQVSKAINDEALR